MLNMRIAVRTKGDPAAVTASARRAVQSIDPDLPLANVATLTRLVDESLAQPRFAMLVLAAFGAIALLLACIGMYGVMSYAVAQRTQEIGIRMALGADRRNVFAVVIGQGARLAGLGIAIGFVAALATTRILASFLFGIGATDPLTFLEVSVVLAATAFVACYLPARRATRVDPLIALKTEP